MKPNEVLMDMWKELRNGANESKMCFVMGAIGALEKTGNISLMEAELWQLRISKCPGHDDESGRAWCAYCGNM